MSIDYNRRFQQAKEVAVRAVKDSYEDNMLHWAAAIAYYAVLSFAPLVFIVISVTSFFVDASWAASRLTSVLNNFLPEESQGQVDQFIQSAVSARGQVGLISSAVFLYTGTRVFAALSRALHAAYDVEAQHRFLRELVVQVAMLLTVGAVFLFALTSGYFYGLLAGAVNFLPAGEQQAARNLIEGAFQVAFLLLAYFLVYRFVPRGESEWKSSLIGALVATALFVIVRPIFIFYLNRSGTQDVIYGSLAALIVLLIWIWISALIVLFGGEIAAIIRRGIPEERH